MQSSLRSERCITTATSLLGYLLFVAKCVRPARTFVSRILAALRSAHTDRVNIDTAFRADLSWFLDFCDEWNGIGIISPARPTRTILVDACLSGVGATDGRRAYGQQVARVADGDANITELEMANVVIALHTFLSKEDRGAHIRVRCDNQAAVSVLNTGRAQNEVLQDCARAAWMVQALLGVDISYDHIPGRDNDVADALSRAHLSVQHTREADRFVEHYALDIVYPCMYYMYNTGAKIFSRSGAVLAPPQGSVTTGRGPGSGHNRQPQGCRTDIIAFMARFGHDPMNPTTEMTCAYLEYVAEHTPAPATVRNKISHVRTFLRLAGRSTAATEHPRVRMALEAMDRDKTDGRNSPCRSNT